MAKEASPKNKKESTEYKIIEHLKPFCDGCKPATLKSYARNIRRLAKFAGLKSVPHNKGWLDGAKGKSLRNKINKENPPSTARHLFTAGSQAFRMYTKGERSAPWQIAMNEAANKYDVQRHKQQKTPKERDSWPKESFKSIGKAASIMKRKITGLMRKSEYTDLQRYEIQKYIILLFYSNASLRLTPATFLISASETENTLLRPKGKRKFVVTLRKHKTQRSMGKLEIPLGISLSKTLSSYINKIKKNAKHDYFLINKDGTKLSKPALSKLLIRLTKNTLGGKGFSVRLMRVLKMSSPANSKLLEKAEALSKELGHSQRTARTYVRKD